MQKSLLFFVLVAIICLAYCSNVKQCAGIDQCNGIENSQPVAQVATLSAEEDHVATLVAAAAKSDASSTKLLAEKMLGEDLTADEKQNVKKSVIKAQFQVPEAPKIEWKVGSLKIGSKCFTGCSWFVFNSTNKPICSGCSALISFDAINNGSDCFALPSDMRNERVSLDSSNFAKRRCAAAGCSCIADAITHENVKEIELKRAQFITMADTSVDWFSLLMTRYTSLIRSKIQNFKYGAICDFQKTALRKRIEEVLSKLKVEFSDTLLTLRQQVVKVTDKASFDKLVIDFNSSVAKYRAKLQNKLDRFVSSLAGMCPVSKFVKALLSRPLKTVGKIVSKVSKALKRL